MAESVSRQNRVTVSNASSTRPASRYDSINLSAASRSAPSPSRNTISHVPPAGNSIGTRQAAQGSKPLPAQPSSSPGEVKAVGTAMSPASPRNAARSQVQEPSPHGRGQVEGALRSRETSSPRPSPRGRGRKETAQNATHLPYTSRSGCVARIAHCWGINSVVTDRDVSHASAPSAQ
jgi:hypothetical protein